MSAESGNTEATFSAPFIKSASEIKREKDTLYRSSFGDLEEGTIYRDPLGVKAGEPVTLQKDRFDQLRDQPVAELGGRSIIEEWNRLQRNGFDIQETTREIRKNLDTGDWTLPVDIIPEVFVVNPERLPMADLMARVSTQDDEVAPTPLTDHPSISWGLEQTDDTEGSYTYSDPTFANLSFDVEGYGAATRVEDKMILASNNLRSAESTQEQAFMRAMRQEEERQIILGTNNNANGFNGLADEGSGLGDVEASTWSSNSDWDEDFRELIDNAEYAGAPRENLAVVTDFDTHRELRNSQLTEVTYRDPGSELMAGFTELSLDDVPIYKSHALPRGSNLSGTDNNIAFTVNMDATYLSVIQEVSVKPLAKVAPQEQFAVDAYATLVFEDDGNHVRSIQADA